MMNDSENLELDNEMANLTDAVLAGRSTKVSASAQSLEPIVRGLQQLAAPVQPSDEFRSRLTQRLSSEFEAQMRTQRSRPSVVALSRRSRALLAAAAAIVLVGIAVLMIGLGNPGEQTPDPNATVGTILGLDTPLAIAALSIFALVLVALFVYFWWRERK
jgi:hypothetical protein